MRALALLTEHEASSWCQTELQDLVAQAKKTKAAIQEHITKTGGECLKEATVALAKAAGGAPDSADWDAGITWGDDWQAISAHAIQTLLAFDVKAMVALIGPVEEAATKHLNKSLGLYVMGEPLGGKEDVLDMSQSDVSAFHVLWALSTASN